MLAGADDKNDVIGGGVGMTLLEGINNGLSRILFDKREPIAHVRAHVIAGALEPKTITLVEGVPDEALGLVTTNLRVGRGLARPAEMLVIVPMPLINLDDRLDDRIVIAPVRAHAGGTGVRGADPAEVAEARVEQLGIGSTFLGRPVQIASGQGPNP